MEFSGIEYMSILLVDINERDIKSQRALRANRDTVTVTLVPISPRSILSIRPIVDVEISTPFIASKRSPFLYRLCPPENQGSAQPHCHLERYSDSTTYESVELLTFSFWLWKFLKMKYVAVRTTTMSTMMTKSFLMIFEL